MRSSRRTPRVLRPRRRRRWRSRPSRSGPLPPKPDQAAPDRRTATGAPTDVAATDVGQQGAFLTTAQGVRLRDTDHSLKAGRRGPDAAAGPPPAGEDHPLRPRAHPRAGRARPRRRRARRLRRLRQRARRSPGPASSAKNVETPVFVRFSTVLGSRGSADTVRDTRGFATKFYTDEGTFDLVGNNIPVFFIQDGDQVPRRHPRRQAAPGPRDPAGAERPRHVLGLRLAAHRGAAPHDVEHVRPRHPALLPDDGGLRRPHLPAASTPTGETTLVKFHWKPVLGVHSLVWEEAQMLAGIDPDFHRRDLPTPSRPAPTRSGSSGIQVFPDTPEQTFEGIDLLDPTKIVPEELAPGAADRPADADRQPDQLLRRDRAGRLPRRPPGARHRRHRRPAAAGAAVLLPRHPAHPAGRAELRTRSRSTARTRRSTTCCATASTSTPCTAAWRRTGRTRSTAAARSSPAPRTARTSRCRRGRRRRRRCARRPRRSTTTSARPGCSG